MYIYIYFFFLIDFFFQFDSFKVIFLFLFWLHWVLVTMHRLSLVEQSRATHCTGFSLR